MMDNMPPKKNKLSAQQTRKMMPVFKQFNAVAKVFISLLTQKLERREKELARISSLITDMSIPENPHSIKITTVDINNTLIKKRGSSSYRQKMDWESGINRKSRGVIL